ncbi:4,5-DOPA dioxygenase extradiol [Pseudonocardia nigra]|uniref:4,5-DOPA-extradiol-dioxygenase n=1 Tax=Pseudonocardia nigra TaxID=1921578 RepID=UPI001C5F80CB|nr:4,5-DOPA dioxygenase extradiol [Pseudonocardia nigra]
MSPMPAAFIGHGSPMNAVEHNRYTDSWAALGAVLPTPRAILVVSAHWYINATAVTAMARPRTIHDFFGHPSELYEIEYPAPGSPEVAAEVAEIAKPTWVGRDVDSWGLDHGTWSVLGHMFPDAAIPVVQLSINAMQSFEYHLELGAKLAPLRERGVMIVGSGNVVHNPGGIDFARPDSGYDWARRFDDDARAAMTGSPDALPGLQGSRDFDAAVPTPDHFIPLLYLAGLGAAADRSAQVLVDGCAYGSLSMTAYTLDLPVPVVPAMGTGAGSISARIPADAANI